MLFIPISVSLISVKYIATSTNSIERSYKTLFRVFLNNNYFVNKLKELKGNDLEIFIFSDDLDW